MSDRTPLQPVAGLARTDKIVAPPTRRPTPAAKTGPVAQTTPPPAPQVTLPDPTPQPPRSASADTVRNVTLSLPIAVVEALRQRAVADQVSQAEVLLDALEATSPRLAQLVADAMPTRQKGLFVRARPRPDDPSTVLPLRILSRNAAVIDELVTQTGAPSRSMMCAVALRAYLNFIAEQR